MSLSGTGVTSSDIEIAESACADIRVDGTDAFSIELNKLSVDPIHSEDSINDSIFTNELDISSLGKEKIQELIERVKTFARLYIGYDKCDEGIVLYVNY